MAKKTPVTDKPLYDLIPSQQTMYIMLKYSIHKEVTQIPATIGIGSKIDFDLLKKAFNIEIERNDALRLRFTKVDGQIKQYFIDPYTVDEVPVKEFKSKEEQNKFFLKDAKTPIKIFKDETFRIYFYKTGDKSGIYFNVSHIVTDALGAAVFYMDLLAVYKALLNGTELPEPLYKYEDHIKREFEYLGNEKRHGKDAEFYKKYWTENGEPFYAGVHGPDLLEKARRKDPSIRVPKAFDPIHDKVVVTTKYMSEAETNALYDYCKEHLITPECVLLYALRAHASKVNYRTPDVLNMLMCGRRAKKQDKLMGGCITQPIQIRVITEETDTFNEAVAKVSNCRTSLLRHMDYPYLEARGMQQKIFGYSTSQGPSCLMFSWLPIGYALQESKLDVDFTAYETGRFVMPLYIFAIPDPKNGGTEFRYMHRTNLISIETIDLLHENAMKALKMGIDNPEITVGEILDNLDDFTD